MQIQLLGTSGCHLCDVAERLMRKLVPIYQFDLAKVDIALDTQLMDEYAMSIPVLRTQGGHELGWPFDEEQFEAWFNSANE